jgi:hypothetical protein
MRFLSFIILVICGLSACEKNKNADQAKKLVSQPAVEATGVDAVIVEQKNADEASSDAQNR